MASSAKLATTPEPALALHQRIRADIEAHILSGEWRPGHRIPYEHELMAQYGCARMTVNKVIAGLASAGLIERRRRAGSFVAQPRLQSAVLTIPDLPSEIAGRGETYRYELITRKRRTAGPGDPAKAGFVSGTPVLELRCRHFANGRPFAVEDRLIGLDTVPEAAEADFATVPPGSWLLGHVPWIAAEHRISAVGAPTREALALDVTKGTPCLSLERRTWRGEVDLRAEGDPASGRTEATITFVRQLFRGDMYDLVARFAPQG